MTDFADYQTPAAHALAIFNQTVPLGHKAGSLGHAGLTVIPASGTATLGPFTFQQVGYEIAISLLANTASTNPFVTVDVQWTNSVTGALVDEQNWQLAGSDTAGGQPYFGTGPSAGDTVKITITNFDTVNSMSYSFTLAQNSRPYLRHDWRNQAMHPVPSFTMANYDQSGHFLLQTGPSIGAGGVATRLLPLYCGKVRIWSTSNLPWDLTIAAVDRTIGIAPAGNQIYQKTITAAAGGNFSDELALPRCTSTIILTNNGASTTTIGATMVLAEQSI